MSHRELRYYKPKGSVFNEPKVKELRDQPHPDFLEKKKTRIL